jgi:DNA-binding PadR family transcriptional regulator
MADEWAWEVEPLFGGAVRTKILGYLAAAEAPRTGYVIAKDLGLSVSKVYPELKRLESTHILRVSRNKKGGREVMLADDDLRRFLHRHVRILTTRDWSLPSAVARREAANAAAGRTRIRVAGTRTRRGKRPFEREFYRPPEKERAAERARAFREAQAADAGKTFSGRIRVEKKRRAR